MTPAQPGDARELVGQQLGAYYIEAPLAIGGQADIFRARDLYTDQQVALKLLPATLSTGRDAVAHLRDEMRRIARLRHPHLLPVVEVASERGLLYAIGMLPAESLRECLERDGLLPPTEAVRYAAELAWALHALHSIGLVHGDVQPANMFFDSQNILRLADFGVTRAAHRQRDTGPHPAIPSRPLAARSYMAPELTQTDDITPQSDIFALGAVFYEMLIGTLPLTALSSAPGGEEITTAPLPPSMRSSEDWPELAAVALKALAPDPARRYPDARAFAVALRAAVFTQQREDQRPSLIAALSGIFHAPGEVDESTFFRRITGAPVPSAPMPGTFHHTGPLDPRHLSYRAAPPAAPAPTSAPAPDIDPTSEDEIATTLLRHGPVSPSAAASASATALDDVTDEIDEDEVSTTVLDRRQLEAEASFDVPPLAPGMPLPPPSVPPWNDSPSPAEGNDDLATAWLAALASAASAPSEIDTAGTPAAAFPSSVAEPDDSPMPPPDELVDDLRQLAGATRPSARPTRANPSWVKALLAMLSGTVLLAALGVTVVAAASTLGFLTPSHAPNAAPGGPTIPTATSMPAATTDVTTPASTLPATNTGSSRGSVFQLPTPTPIPPVRTPNPGGP